MFGRTSKVLTNFIKNVHTTSKAHKEFENPIWRTFRILKEDFTRIRPKTENDFERERALMGLFPRHADVVIIGGGAIGSSIAYWLKEKSQREGLRVVVIEKDITYSKCSTRLSAGSLHQQFSLPENIQMAIYGAEFLRKIKKRFGQAADVGFTPQGYLVLADEESAQSLVDCSTIQKQLGANNVLLSQDQLRSRFPWMNVEDVEVGSLGVECEGWFDPWALLTLLRSGAANSGAQYIDGEVVDFTFKDREDFYIEGVHENSYESLNEVIIKMPNGEHRAIEFAYCVIAAGCQSAELAQLAKIGGGCGMLSVPLPITKTNQYLYKFECSENPPGLNAPMTVDHSGVFIRRAGLCGSFLAGLSPQDDPETPVDEYFKKTISPILENRIPAFKSVQLKDCWSGLYETNCFDDTGIIGLHPYYHNLFLATGFSGHGIQQAPAVGRAISELIIDGDYKTIDLTRFGFDRLIVDKPMYELAAS